MSVLLFGMKITIKCLSKEICIDSSLNHRNPANPIAHEVATRSSIKDELSVASLSINRFIISMVIGFFFVLGVIRDLLVLSTIFLQIPSSSGLRLSSGQREWNHFSAEWALFVEEADMLSLISRR